ncbi:MetQ/NlpA family ABC transporter substrate-binding protein [uncultured Enterococcus sp.]|uniref:MetQ/NlpA family ABC transporter substrate-binding protein n=1 Tax=uncultured Enterococcus sp. TaxID=167972 RepID=UPI0025E74251|nr:MetQ/NlpA family ABC transporter substrate-binding protein [uncultured Enterococcus sp.]
MKTTTKWGLVALGFVATFVLGACGSSASGQEDDTKLETKVVGVAPGPYGEMVTDVISPLLKEKGFVLETKLFNDYIQPNKALAGGQIDANLFQHTSYLEKFAKDNDLKLSVVQQVPTLGMGLYSTKLKELSEISDQQTIAIPNDASNLARALKLLAANDLITLKADIDETKATVNDIATNPKNLTIKPLEAAQLVRSLDTVDVAAVPGNFAWAAKLDPADALALEKLTDNYKNVFVVRTDEKDSKFAKAVKEVLDSKAFQEKIADSPFKNFEHPAFWSEQK